MNLHGLKTLLTRPTWSKDVVVWIGSNEPLNDALETCTLERLDLLELFPDDDDLPISNDDRAHILKQQLDLKLRGMKPVDSQKLILRVSNAALLAKYGVGLQAFFDWFCGSNTMAVLEVNRSKSVELPDSLSANISFDSEWLANYFRPLLAKPENLCVEVD